MLPRVIEGVDFESDVVCIDSDAPTPDMSKITRWRGRTRRIARKIVHRPTIFIRALERAQNFESTVLKSKNSQTPIFRKSPFIKSAQNTLSSSDFRLSSKHVPKGYRGRRIRIWCRLHRQRRAITRYERNDAMTRTNEAHCSKNRP